ncbi:MAG: hypothetical protein ACRDRN_09770 [Sciscionella sp.]
MTRVHLHVGAPKTGTTYLQGVLWRNRSSLRDNGILYPAYNSEAHLHAAMDLQAGQLAPEQNVSVPGTWQRLVAEARDWRGTTVISHESFSTATRAEIDGALSDLSFADVHLVYTVRDLGRQIPAVWQEDVKNRHTLGFEEFLADIADRPPEAHWLVELFWRFQDTLEVLRRWGGSLPPERVHVVTVPPKGSPPGLLWERFARVLGADPATYDCEIGVANRSLGWAETELLRRVNLAVESAEAGVDRDGYARAVRDVLVDQVLAGRRDTVPLLLPAHHHDWVTERALGLIKGIQAAGYQVTGELDDLLPRLPADPPRQPDTAEQLDAAVEAMGSLVRQLAQPRPARSVAQFRQALRDLSYRNDAVMLLRRWYWNAKVRLPARGKPGGR